MKNKLAMLLLVIAAMGVSIPYTSGEHDGSGERRRDKAEKVLYVWSSDQAHRAPDFLAVVDFDDDSRTYGNVINTVRIPPPGNIGNEAHHCHLSADEKVLGC